MRFKVTFKNGDSVLLEGEDIAEAYNRVGYTEANIDAADDIEEVIVADNHDPDFPLLACSCPQCYSHMSMHKEVIPDSPKHHKKHRYYYVCDRCGATTPKANSEIGARIQQNYACLGTTPLSQSAVNQIAQRVYHRVFNEEEHELVAY